MTQQKVTRLRSHLFQSCLSATFRRSPQRGSGRVPAPALFGITKLGIGGGTGLFLSVVMEDDEEEDSFSGGGKTRVCEDEEEHGVLIAGVSPEPDCEGASLELYFREGGKESLGDLELPLAESGGRNIDAIAVPFDL